MAVMVTPLINSSFEHFMLSGMYLSFTNIMACRAFRGIALGQLNNNIQIDLTSTMIDAAFQLDPPASL